MVECWNGAPITVWDSSADASGRAGPIYRWNGYAETESVRSLFRYAEIHGDRFRERYLAWIHELGESQIEGQRLVDHLALDDGLSYWWMTPFVEKSPWKTPSVIDAIRLFAIEEIVVHQRPGALRLVSANRNLHLTLRDLCRNLGMSYGWERIPNGQLRQLSLRSIYRALPQPVQGLLDLVRYVRARWPLRKAEKSRWFDGDRSLFICSYFFHIDVDLAKKGRFHSQYWGGLHDLMEEMGLTANWLQIYYPHAAVPNPKVALDWARRFNRQRQTQGFHFFADAYVSWRALPRVLKRWFKLTLVCWRVRGIKWAFSPAGSRLSLWPLMQRDWHAAMRGSVAVSNLLWVELFDEAMRDIPRQRKGLYLCENQAWERAMIHAWRKHGHGELIAVAHSTVRFWDLRYFIDARTLGRRGPYSMPRPDRIALNGKAAMDAYLSMDYPKEAIAECEALRYGYLNSLRGAASLSGVKGAAKKVLILGDFMPSAMVKMLELIEAAARQLSPPLSYTVKPHPNFMIKAENYPSLNLEIVTGPLENFIQDYDIAYSSNLTSAAVDAYLAGLPVVVMLNATELNFSPLRGQSGVRFVSTPEELADSLRTYDQKMTRHPDRSDFFFLDPELPRWRSLLQARANQVQSTIGVN